MSVGNQQMAVAYNLTRTGRLARASFKAALYTNGQEELFYGFTAFASRNVGEKLSKNDNDHDCWWI